MSGKYLNSPDIDAECKSIDAQMRALEDELDPHTCDNDDCDSPMSHGTAWGLSYTAAKVLLTRLKAATNA